MFNLIQSTYFLQGAEVPTKAIQVSQQQDQILIKWMAWPLNTQPVNSALRTTGTCLPFLTMRYYKNPGVKTYQLLKSMCLLYPLCIQVVWRPIKNIILLLVSYITHRWNGKFISVTMIFQTYLIKCSQRKDLTAEKCEYYRKEIIGFFAHFQARIFCLILFTSSIDHPL